MKSKKMSVAMLGHKRIPSRNGGIETVLTELSPRLVQFGTKVTAFNRLKQKVADQDFVKPTEREYRGVYLRNAFTITGKGLAAISSSFFGAIAASFGKYDIVHFHAEGPSAMLWIPKLFGKKCVVTIHGLDWKRDKWKGSIGSKYILFGEKMAAKYADAIIVLNSDTSKYFKEKYNKDTYFIANGITPAVIDHETKNIDQYDICPQRYFLSLSRLTPEKGIHTLIEAFKKLDTDFKLIIAGDTSDSDEYVKSLHVLAQNDERIIFTGFVGGDLLNELYSNAYAYVLPSQIEGMPLTLLEAMSYGNAVISTNIPEIKEVVGDEHALMSNPGDVDGLRNSMEVLLFDSDLQQKLKNTSADYVLQKYDWDEIALKTIDVYQNVLAEGR